MTVDLHKKMTGKEFYEYKLYLLVRNDLPSMNVGKAIAQAAHAANQFIFEHGNNGHVKAWQAESGDGFGTTITLTVDRAKLIETITYKCKQFPCQVLAGIVTDTTYPYIINKEILALIDQEKHNTADPIHKPTGEVVAFRSEETCGYIFVINGTEAQKELTSMLPLHP